MRKAQCLWFIMLFPIFTFAQSCTNSDLESGTLDGFTAFYGHINKSGQVILEAAGALPYRHDIMHLSDGFDTVALAHCEINRLLPVVPPEGGQYTLRLGNAIAGSKSEKVVFRLTVTDELSFFQLRYAVLLNDPDHEYHEQPRFELRISGINNNTIPCGEYKVRAAKEIPDFESCREGWRVRPWTTVGFDLRDYLGQELQIEFLTSDCSKGAHAGYAYLEATCKSLEMEIEEFCPGAAVTTASASPGFKDYLWNTGARTSNIEITDPQVDFPYQVTVTSATGCTFTLEDQIADTPKPNFIPERSRSYCRDTQYWFTPQGTNLHELYSPTLDLAADSFLIGTSTSDYTFISNSSMGCFSDTLTLSLAKRQLPLTSSLDKIQCYGDRNGRIELQSETDFPPLQYQWEHSARSAILTDLPAGNYTVTVSDAIQCTSTTTITISSPLELLLEEVEEQSISCYGMDDGLLSIQPSGGTAPYQFNWSAGSRNINTVQDLSSGTYEVTVVDANGCTTEYNTFLEEPDPLNVHFFTSNINCFGGTDGLIELDIQGGTPPYSIDWDRYNMTQEPILEKVPAGDYQVLVFDDRNCVKELDITLYQPSFHKSCGTYIPNIFSPNGDQQNDVFFVAGSLAATSLNSMKIFNRWGELVFENDNHCSTIGDPACGWNGNMDNKPAPTGVYLYLIQVEVAHQAEPIIYSGDVTLVR